MCHHLLLLVDNDVFHFTFSVTKEARCWSLDIRFLAMSNSQNGDVTIIDLCDDSSSTSGESRHSCVPSNIHNEDELLLDCSFSRKNLVSPVRDGDLKDNNNVDLSKRQYDTQMLGRKGTDANLCTHTLHCNHEVSTCSHYISSVHVE